MNTTKKSQDPNTVEFNTISEINVLRTLVAFCNTNGGTIDIKNDKKEIDEEYFWANIKDSKKLPYWLVQNNNSEDSHLLSRSIDFSYITRGNKSFFSIKINSCKFKNGYLYLTNGDKGKEYYFRVNRKNIRVDEEHVSYWAKIALYDAPKYVDYQPNDESLKSKLEKVRNRIDVKAIGDQIRNDYVYKYLDLEATLRSLENKNFRFVEPTNWDDQYEGRFYNAKYKKTGNSNLNPNLTPFLYATCLTTKPENEAAWILYPHNKKGLASRCVEFKLNKKKLLDQMIHYVLNSWNTPNGEKCSLYFGRVEYLSKSDIENLHKKKIGIKENLNYKKYFDNFSLECYLNLLLLKREAFKHEEELRVFIVPKVGKTKTRRAKNGNYIQNNKIGKSIRPQDTLINIDWGSIIEEVRIDKNCTEYEKGLLKDRLKYVNPNIPIDDKYDPYEDKSLKKGPLKIETN